MVTIRQEKIVYLQHLRKCRENPYNEELIKTFVEVAGKYCSQPCKAEGNYSFGRTLNKMIEHLPICKNPTELNCTMDAVKRAKHDIVQNPCVLSDYKAVKATNNMGGDKAIFKLVVDEMVKVKEEYLVFDTVSMISVVGGFMGLCVGLSFYDASGILLRCLEITLVKWKRKFRENKNVEELSEALTSYSV